MSSRASLADGVAPTSLLRAERSDGRDDLRVILAAVRAGARCTYICTRVQPAPETAARAVMNRLRQHRSHSAAPCSLASPSPMFSAALPRARCLL